MYNGPVRGGTRGGRDQFKWDDVRYMSYKDREQYLGSSTIIGFLDKGGKWRMKDWYLKGGKKSAADEKLNDEIKKIQARDEKRMRVALGLETQEEQQQQMLTQQQIEEINRRIKENKELDYQPSEDQMMPGLGYKMTDTKLKIPKQLNKDDLAYNRLEGEGVILDKEQKQKKNEEKISKKKIKKEKKDKKSKKDKKDKKKKEKHKHKEKKEKQKKNKQQVSDSDD